MRLLLVAILVTTPLWAQESEQGIEDVCVGDVCGETFRAQQQEAYRLDVQRQQDLETEQRLESLERRYQPVGYQRIEVPVYRNYDSLGSTRAEHDFSFKYEPQMPAFPPAGTYDR